MFCCTCAGVCNHVGPHSFCAAHGGGGSTWPTMVTPGTVTPMAWPTVSDLHTCEHCFCTDSTRRYGERAHVECCMCRTRKLKS